MHGGKAGLTKYLKMDSSSWGICISYLCHCVQLYILYVLFLSLNISRCAEIHLSSNFELLSQRHIGWLREAVISLSLEISQKVMLKLDSTALSYN